MKVTLNIDDQIIAEAARLTGIKEKTTLVRKGLEALIAQESSPGQQTTRQTSVRR
ncbi:type II toxin-antitoxin system VapB family antitoxin [Pontiellaceae bacterium B12227]|nr:type II toxin-antitoxin system VapB family antitoxin [Pontiellaceae bacterium B12227]